jgi:hypothetical protein
MRAGGFTIPVAFDGLTLLAGLLALLALASLASGVVHMARERRIRPLRFGGGVIMLLLGLAVFAVAGWAQTYRALTHNELVGTVRAVPVAGRIQTMQVTYTPIQDGKPGTPHTYAVRGDEWQLGGDIIKWQDYLNILGVHTGYRTTRLMGYYEDPNDYRVKPVTAYNLDNGSDTVQTFLHEHPNLVPFVRATYGNDVRMLPDANVIYQVYVSTSGYWTAQQ